MKLSKKVTSAVLASMLTLSMVVSAFAADATPSKTAADTPVKATDAIVDATDKSNVNTVDTTAKGNASIAEVDNVKTAKIPATVTVGGVKYTVTTIKANAFKGATKVKTIKVAASKITFKKNATKGASKLTNIKLNKVKKASQVTFKKGCFNGNKKLKTIYVSKKTTAKQLKAIKKALKKAGYSKIKVKATL